MQNYKLEVAARALILKDNKLLLVSNEGKFWYSPGGRLNPNETLSECVIREVKEETGIDVEVTDASSVYDFFDTVDNIHKVEVYFFVRIKSLEIPRHSGDKDGPVKFVKFFSQQELEESSDFAPGFLKDFAFMRHNNQKIYKGHEVK